MSDDQIAPGTLPPLKSRDLPEPIPLRRMIGPSVILVGLAIGSGEFILWPHITYKSGFVFFWACMLGVITQYFINTEIERWTLATGETAITGFCRLSRLWAGVFLVCNIVPWAWPGWATGSAKILSWMVWGTQETGRSVTAIAVGSLVVIGVVLTAGPVVYTTVERIQKALVALILVMALVITVAVVRSDAVVAMAVGTVNIGGMPPASAGLEFWALLGAIAFAGAGGTTNLGQSNLIRDKGYGMGKYIGRITSPITGKPEAIPEVGYTFPHTPENLSRWSAWWLAARREHFYSFFLTCVFTLVVMALISYSLFYEVSGALKPGMERFGKGMDFVWGEATVLATMGASGPALKTCFLILGVAILLTTELGILDVVARISTDIVRTNWLRDHPTWTSGRLYFTFLWSEIVLGIAILLSGEQEPQRLIAISAALNGAVMFVYCIVLLYLNAKVLPRPLKIGAARFALMVWAILFYGYFTVMAAVLLPKLLA